MSPEVVQRLALAEHLLDTRALERADDVLDQVAADAMHIPEFWWLRARVAAVRKRPEAAIRAAEAGLARFPRSVPLLVVLGEERLDLGRMTEAEQALLAALAIEPEDVDALCSYAHLVARVGQTEKAKRLLDRAATIEPESTRILATRYQVANLEGDDRETARLSVELARRSDGDPHAIALLGLEAAKRTEPRASRDLLQRAARGDVRVVDTLGADTFREIRAASHPLMWPLWPVARFGPGVVWVAGVGTLLALRALGSETAMGIGAVVWIGYVVYSWVIPPIVRRLAGGRR